MLRCAVLRCAVLCCAVLCCAALSCTELRCTATVSNASPLVTGCPCRAQGASFETSRGCALHRPADVCQVTEGAANRLSRHAAAVRPNAYSTVLPQMFAKSLRELQTEYIDMLLLHYPDCWGSLCSGTKSVEGAWQDRCVSCVSAAHGFSMLGRKLRGGTKSVEARGRTGWAGESTGAVTGPRSLQPHAWYCCHGAAHTRAARLC